MVRWKKHDTAKHADWSSPVPAKSVVEIELERGGRNVFFANEVCWGPRDHGWAVRRYRVLEAAN